MNYSICDDIIRFAFKNGVVNVDVLYNYLNTKGTYRELTKGELLENIEELNKSSIIKYFVFQNSYMLEYLAEYYIESGGVEAYMNDFRSRIQESIDLDNLKKEKEKLDFKNAKRQVWTFRVSIIALVISAALAFLKIAETFKFWPYGG